MITAIEIENFKAIGKRVRFELKPITLLFGPNSSGKSTVLQAIHYAREIFERHNLDPDRTVGGGEAMDLGGFRNLVHDHDLDREAKLKFDLDLSDQDLPDFGLTDDMYREAHWVHEEFDDYQRYAVDRGIFSKVVERASVEITVVWSDLLNRPILREYAVGLNGEPFASFLTSRDGKTTELGFSYRHSLFEEAGVEVPDTDIKIPLGFLSLISRIMEQTEEGDYRFPIKVSAKESAFPDLDKPLKFGPERFLPDEGSRLAHLENQRILSQAMVGPGQLIRDELRKFRYLGPIREQPPRNFVPVRSPGEERWASGLAAWDLLYSGPTGLLVETSHWLSDDMRLNAGYSLSMKEYKELEVNGAAYLAIREGRMLDQAEEIAEELNRLPTFRRLSLVEEGTMLEVLPQDVGEGISQLLPVVTLALDLDEGIAAIEQPELHIHPAIQVGLGDLFASQIQEGNKVFLLESHSEHLMLRLLRRIEQHSNDDLPPDAPELTPDQVAVYFIEQGQEGAKATRLRIDKDGEFIDRWPKGFFEERAEELFG